MPSFYTIRLFLLFSLLTIVPIFCRDVILEFKGACFVPTNHTFRNAYTHAGALYGPELTVQLLNDKPWYAFASADYFQKKGKDLGLADSTKLRMLPLALGMKYFFTITDRTNLYVGLGFEPAYVHTKSSHGCVTSKTSQWCFGGIGKVGAYIDLKRNFVLDLFFDYSFLRTKKEHFYGPTRTASKASLSGAIFGAGLGYKF